ncbi:MAG: ABC transporter ATP-binding protein [Albidovulum sp.]|nr:ABC transporter ATP-binding protein [Albidovulum sp.]MDE0307913.1 ABC transporter ATP-binding protein [Albidovulum sp.]
MKDVQIESVSKVFGADGDNGFTALKDVSLAIDGGEFLSLLGPSGCGKSTLLRCIAGLEKPTQGMVTIGGGAGKPGFDTIGLVFQSSNLLPWLTVLDNVLYPVRVKSRSLVRQYRDRAMELIDQVGLTHVANQLPDSLSGGMQQRAGIARGLVMDPDILLMDEPFSALDAMTREELQFELIRLHHETGKTFVFVTHSIPEAIFLSSKIAVMESFPGRISQILDVEFPHPRGLEILNSDRAIEIDGAIRASIYSRSSQHNSSSKDI